MSAKYTPGPWMVHDSKGCRWIETHSDDVVAQVFKDDCSRETFDANARLIAAAPDLLEALMLLADEFDGLPRSMGYEFTHINKARAAIAKATGENQ